ncbi:MAG: TIGR04283 family arsenosugar biosynthesis glycosyltransferase [Nitrospiraceae bacterium]
MTISVVMPVLNESRALAVTLPHTLSLGFDELIIVDGGSADGTVEQARAAAEQRPPHRRVPSVAIITAPAGRATQMNAGATVAQGEVLLFLHADTLLPNDARRQIMKTLDDPAVVAGRFDVRFDRDTPLSRIIARLMNVRSRRTGMITGDQALFVRTSTFHALGGFASIPLMEDLQLSRRLKQAGKVTALRAQVVTSYRRWAHCGPIRTIVRMWSIRFLYWLGVSPDRLARYYRPIR